MPRGDISYIPVCAWNANSILAKLLGVIEFMRRYNVDIVLVLRRTSEQDMINILGYGTYQSDCTIIGLSLEHHEVSVPVLADIKATKL